MLRRKQRELFSVIVAGDSQPLRTRIAILVSQVCWYWHLGHCFNITLHSLTTAASGVSSFKVRIPTPTHSNDLISNTLNRPTSLQPSTISLNPSSIPASCPNPQNNTLYPTTTTTPPLPLPLPTTAPTRRHPPPPSRQSTSQPGSASGSSSWRSAPSSKRTQPQRFTRF
ncbi:uncharacterized protein BDZ99DRAFT_185942 [Mytilinidion resinicola]|uniref:Uncharacterized protein n=1 Tax=Mytilinidion resinicola TaxID=574789 RepID=A0A6A6Z1I7_9PEZI|nr:uncharacterized protein BDZ99DRAFT_185942 [Mytilinidion resinicola]KAF2814860.1 hypothetical protein BDZ99DRAFT_185942 [Mytilinidion resinicola]